MSQYTPEPWNHANIPDSDSGMVEIYNKPWGMGIVGYAMTIEDAQRAVKCVNACKGMEDPAKYIADLQAQLDLAVKALEKISQSPHPTNSNEFGIWEEVARCIAQNTLTQIKGGEDES